MSRIPNNLATVSWSTAEFLSDEVRQSHFDCIILPFILLRGVQCAQNTGLAEYEKFRQGEIKDLISDDREFL